MCTDRHLSPPPWIQPGGLVFLHLPLLVVDQGNAHVFMPTALHGGVEWDAVEPTLCHESPAQGMCGIMPGILANGLYAGFDDL